MKSLSALLILAIIGTASCKKTEDNTPQTGGPIFSGQGRQWTIGDKTYTVNNYSKTSDNNYTAYDTAGNGIGFSFSPYPTTADNYTIINDDSTVGPQQVSVFVFGSVSGNTYFSTGTENKTAAISFENGKIKIVLSGVWVKKAYSNDSLKASANLIPF